MKKLFLILLGVLLSTRLADAQSLQDKTWDALLKNDRARAAKLAKSLRSKRDMESIILRQVVRQESGITARDDNFYNQFKKRPDFEYYMYALKTEDYMFGKVANSENYNTDLFRNIDEFAKLHYKNPTVNLMMQDLKYTADYYRNDFENARKGFNAMPGIKKWQYIGAFENLNNSGISIVYGPETRAVNPNGYNANSNGIINWYVPVHKTSGAFVHPVNMAEYGSGIFYVQTFVNNPKDRDVYIRFRADDTQKMWLDDVQIFEKTKPDRPTGLDYYTVKVHMPRGMNRLLVKMSTSGGTYVRITDAGGKDIAGLTFSDQYKKYIKSDPKTIGPEQLPNPFETYFDKLAAAHPNKFFYDFMRIKLYLRQSREDKAKPIIEKYLKKYPKSSLLRYLMLQVYQLEDNDDKLQEIKENLLNDDPYYYISAQFKLADFKKLQQKDMAEFKEEMKKIKASTDNPFLKETVDLLVAARTNDAQGIYKSLTGLMDYAEQKAEIQAFITWGSIWAKNFKQMPAFKNRIKKLMKKYYHSALYRKLIGIYDDENQTSKIISLLKKWKSIVPYRNDIKGALADYYISLKKYKDALPYMDDALADFPYSFTAMEKKGMILQHLNRKKEAVKWYKKALSHNSADNDLRKKIWDLEGITDPIKPLMHTDYYTYIKKNRGKIKDNHYGINVLLEEHGIQVFDEGGHKERRIYIYEVTSDKGIERLKEMNFNTAGHTVFIKSEIVKPNGSVVPADRSGGHLVFSNLEKGDVILVDVESTIAETGRFYKDYEDYFSVNGFNPERKYHFVLLLPKNMKLQNKVLHGVSKLKKSPYKQWIKYEWAEDNPKTLPPDEDYMPPFVDVATELHLSTIDSWDKIAQWYKDLSSESIEYNDVVNKTFDEIFPDGYKNLTETQRAKRIYDWMHDNITYSYVDFRQSGYIPQKPAHVIESKLGDCKDVSTLFVTLGRKAGLQANLVLVNTNDNGIDQTVLPSVNFNHAIVRVMLDGKKRYLELTDKYLPFLSLPTTLANATILEIPYKDGDGNDVEKGLLHLNTFPQIKASKRTDVEYVIGKDNAQDITITFTGRGRVNSNYNEMLDEDNEEQLKKQLQKFFENFDDLDLELVDYKIISKDKKADKSVFRVHFRIKNKIQKLGSKRIFKLPLQMEIYTADLIKLDDRKYPIRYSRYENAEHYEMHYTIRLKNGKRFTDVPTRKLFQWKGHSYKVSYKRVSPTTLRVDIVANVPIKDISPAEYAAFKKYVRNVLESTEELIGF